MDHSGDKFAAQAIFFGTEVLREMVEIQSENRRWF
jgi:hypothetical protein